MNKFLNLFLKGIFVGIANIIPGVSGGTIAVVLRIFDQMIEAINNFFKNPKKHIKFLFPLFLGAGGGIILFSKLLEFCLKKESLPTSMFFVGLVVGSVPLIYNQAKKKEIKPIYFLISVIFFGIVVLLSLLKEPTSTSTNVNISVPWLIKACLSGVISSAAMVIPGISGSFVMVLLGLYNVVLTSISNLTNIISEGLKLMISGEFTNGFMFIIKSDSFIILLVVGIGVIIGVILISKIIAILLEKAFSLTYFAILGLIFGSIFAIFKDPMTYESYSNNIPIFSIILSIITFVGGFFISIKLGKEE